MLYYRAWICRYECCNEKIFNELSLEELYKNKLKESSRDKKDRISQLDSIINDSKKEIIKIEEEIEKMFIEINIIMNNLNKMALKYMMN